VWKQKTPISMNTAAAVEVKKYKIPRMPLQNRKYAI
jgi:hypothetical protein